MNPTLQAKLKAKVNTRTTQPCPDCGALLVIRMRREDETFFLGCSRFKDNCRHTEEIPESVIVELLGYKKLPGFDGEPIKHLRVKPRTEEESPHEPGEFLAGAHAEFTREQQALGFIPTPPHPSKMNRPQNPNRCPWSRLVRMGKSTE